jgi:DnaJ-class molecular chaperone
MLDGSMADVIVTIQVIKHDFFFRLKGNHFDEADLMMDFEISHKDSLKRIENKCIGRHMDNREQLFLSTPIHQEIISGTIICIPNKGMYKAYDNRSGGLFVRLNVTPSYRGTTHTTVYKSLFIHAYYVSAFVSRSLMVRRRR